jgi:alkylation response protein AidB-like acyl-CoA dehydrogenase
MDFSLSEEQEAIRDLASQILEDNCTHERLKEIEATDDLIDRELTEQLAKAHLLGIAISEEYGGADFGLLALYVFLEQLGRFVAPTPTMVSSVAALAVQEFGSASLKQAILPGVVEGEITLCFGIAESAMDDLQQPALTATQTDDGWSLSGEKICVLYAPVADHILVNAKTNAGDAGLFLVDLTTAGVTRENVVITSLQPASHVLFDKVKISSDAALNEGDSDTNKIAWFQDRVTVAVCSVETGVCEQALKITAAYTKEREQFDKPIGSFQAVGQRAADAYIDTEAVRLTALQAAWRLSENLPAAQELAIAKFFSAEAGHRVVYACQHLHGGIGVDVDYPIHRYYIWSRQLELMLGGANSQLAELGKLLAK